MKRLLGIFLLLALVGSISTFAWSSSAGDPAPTVTTLATLATSAPPVADASPTPEPEWRYPAGSRVGGIDIGGLTEAEAQTHLERATADLRRPFTLAAGGQTMVVKAEKIGLYLPIAQQLQAVRLSGANDVPLEAEYDQTLLDTLLADFADQIAVAPTLAYSPTSATFVYTPGLRLDLDAAQAHIQAFLEQPTTTRRIGLPTQPITDAPRVSADQLIAALAQREAEWGGIIGVAVYDPRTDETISYHGDTVFSGASVLKIPILLQAYISRATFTPEQREAIKLMIEISDNEAANDLLAMIGDGDGLEGTKQMNATLANIIGVKYTDMAAPFESIDYLSKFLDIEIPQRGIEGAEPYTDADPYVRTTPNEMTQVLAAIVACANGGGPLLDVANTNLTAARCEEMIKVLHGNTDPNKIVAGVPADAYVAHKSGWIDDARADAGIVRTADGDEYIVSLWMWEVGYIETEVSDPLLADLSRIVYTSRHPQMITSAR